MFSTYAGHTNVYEGKIMNAENAVMLLDQVTQGLAVNRATHMNVVEALKVLNELVQRTKDEPKTR